MALVIAVLTPMSSITAYGYYDYYDYSTTTNVDTDTTDVYSDETRIWASDSLTYIGNMDVNAGVIRNINNYSKLSAYNPSLSDLPDLKAEVMKKGNYATLYDGFYNLDNAKFLEDIKLQSKDFDDIKNVQGFRGVLVENKAVGKLSSSGLAMENSISPSNTLDNATNTELQDPEEALNDEYLNLTEKEVLMENNLTSISGRYESREDKILGYDINVVMDTVSTKKVDTPVNQEASDFEVGNAGQLLGYQDSFYDREYVVEQFTVNPTSVALLYQILPMLYKAKGEYAYDVYAWSSRATPDPEDILPLSKIPLLSAIDWIGGTVKSSKFFADVYVSRSDLRRYIGRATHDGLIDKLPGYDKFGQVMLRAAVVESNSGVKDPDWVNRDYIIDFSNGTADTEAKRRDAQKSATVEKLVSDGKVQPTTIEYFNKELTHKEFFAILKHFMVLYGEPELNKREESALLAAYGASIPMYLEKADLKNAKYLLARGIIDPDEVNLDYNSEITIGQVKTYLMRMKDENSRLSFKQVTVDYNHDLVEKGYAVVETDNNLPGISSVEIYDPSPIPEYRDIFIEISPETQFRSKQNANVPARPYFTGVFFGEPQQKYISDIDYMGQIQSDITGKDYYHFRYFKDRPVVEDASSDGVVTVPISMARKWHFSDKIEGAGGNNKLYVSLNSLDRGNEPYAMAIPYKPFEDAKEEMSVPGVMAEEYTSRDNHYYYFGSVITGGVFSYYKTYKYMNEHNTSMLDYAGTIESIFGDKVSYIDEPMLHSKGYFNDSHIVKKLSENKNMTAITFNIDSDPKYYEWGRQSPISLRDLIQGTSSNSLENKNVHYSAKATCVPDLQSEGDFPEGGYRVTLVLDIANQTIEPMNILVQYLRYKTLPEGKQSYITYVAGINSIMVPFNYLKEQGYVSGIAKSTTQGKNNGDTYQIIGARTNIYVIKNWNGTGRTRTIYGNVCVDFLTGEPSPIIVEDPANIQESLIDYRLIFGVTNDFLNMRTPDGKVNASVPGSKDYSVTSYSSAAVTVQASTEAAAEQATNASVLAEPESDNASNSRYTTEAKTVTDFAKELFNDESIEAMARVLFLNNEHMANLINNIETYRGGEGRTSEELAEINKYFVENDRRSNPEAAKEALTKDDAQIFSNSEIDKKALMYYYGLEPLPTNSSVDMYNNYATAMNNYASARIRYDEAVRGNSLSTVDYFKKAYDTAKEEATKARSEISQIVGGLTTSLFNSLSDLFALEGQELSSTDGPPLVIEEETLLTRALNRVSDTLTTKVYAAGTEDTSLDGLEPFIAKVNNPLQLDGAPMVQRTLQAYRYKDPKTDTHKYMMLLESTNYLGNYLIYQRSQSGSNIDYLIVFKSYDPKKKDLYTKGGELYTHEQSKAELEGTGVGLALLPSEIAYIYRLSHSSYINPQVFTSMASESSIIEDLFEFESDMLPAVSKGPYGYQYTVRSMWNLPKNGKGVQTNMYNYLYTDSDAYPIPMFLNFTPTGGGSHHVDTTELALNTNYQSFTDLNMNKVSVHRSGGNPSIENLILFNGLTYDLNVNQEDAGINPKHISSTLNDVTSIDVERAPTGVISRLYHVPGPMDFSISDVKAGKGTIFYGSMGVKKEKEPNSDTEVVTMGRIGSFTLKVPMYLNGAKSAPTDKTLRPIFHTALNTVYAIDEISSDQYTNFERGSGESLIKRATWDVKVRSAYHYDFNKWADLLKLDTFETIITLLMVVITLWLPMLLEAVLITIATLSLVKDFPFVQAFCAKVFDPIKLLSVRLTDVHTIDRKRIWILTLIASILFALVMRGVLLDVLAWLSELLINIAGRLL